MPLSCRRWHWRNSWPAGAESRGVDLSSAAGSHELSDRISDALAFAARVGRRMVVGRGTPVSEERPRGRAGLEWRSSTFLAEYPGMGRGPGEAEGIRFYGGGSDSSPMASTAWAAAATGRSLLIRVHSRFLCLESPPPPRVRRRSQWRPKPRRLRLQAGPSPIRVHPCASVVLPPRTSVTSVTSVVRLVAPGHRAGSIPGSEPSGRCLVPGGFYPVVEASSSSLS